MAAAGEKLARHAAVNSVQPYSTDSANVKPQLEAFDAAAPDSETEEGKDENDRDPDRRVDSVLGNRVGGGLSELVGHDCDELRPRRSLRRHSTSGSATTACG